MDGEREMVALEAKTDEVRAVIKVEGRMTEGCRG